MSRHRRPVSADHRWRLFHDLELAIGLQRDIAAGPVQDVRRPSRVDPLQSPGKVLAINPYRASGFVKHTVIEDAAVVAAIDRGVEGPKVSRRTLWPKMISTSCERPTGITGQPTADLNRSGTDWPEQPTDQSAQRTMSTERTGPIR
jgi:hypothetical protein